MGSYLGAVIVNMAHQLDRVTTLGPWQSVSCLGPNKHTNKEKEIKKKKKFKPSPVSGSKIKAGANPDWSDLYQTNNKSGSEQFGKVSYFVCTMQIHFWVENSSPEDTSGGKL